MSKNENDFENNKKRLRFHKELVSNDYDKNTNTRQ